MNKPVNINMELDKEILDLKFAMGLLSPYKRTELIRHFLIEYPLDSTIYCCHKCQILVGDDVGEGHYPINVSICDKCQYFVCKACATVNEEKDIWECKKC